MYRKIVTLFCITFVVGIQGASRRVPTSLDDDVIELAQLGERIWSMKPDILLRSKPLVYCQIMDQCCNEEQRSEAMSLLNPSREDLEIEPFEDFMEQCMNTSISKKEKQSCTTLSRSVVPFWTVFRNPNVNKYMAILDKYIGSLKKLEEWASDCNIEEAYAIICLSDTKLFESCTTKILENIYDSDYKNYEKTVQNVKQVFNNAITELNMVLNKNTKKN